MTPPKAAAAQADGAKGVHLSRDRQYKWLPIDKIIPNERNPRSSPAFSEHNLADLRRSVEQHGILEPLIVQPYTRGKYVLIEGERRYHVAQLLGLKEVPCMVEPKKLEPDDQVIVMYNLHENRKGWEMADHLRAIQRLMQSRPELSEEELAKQLGLSAATFRDRLRVLGLGQRVVNKIAAGELDYTSALRAAQAATAITKRRPELAEKLGGEKKITDQLLKKAEKRGGISHELTSGKQDLTDTQHVPDAVIETYLVNEEKGLREAQREKAPATAQRRQVRDLAKDVLKIEETLQGLAEADFSQAPNLRQLRAALGGLISIATALENKVTEAILAAEAAPQTDTKPIRRRRKPAAPKSPQEAMQAEEDRKAKEQADAAVEEALERAGA